MRTCVVCGTKIYSRNKKADRCNACWVKVVEKGGSTPIFDHCTCCGRAIDVEYNSLCFDCSLENSPY